MVEESLSIIARVFLAIGRFFAEDLFDTVCGYIGHHTVRVVTFGKVHIHPTHGGESALASIIGLFVLLGCLVGFAMFVLPTTG